MIIHFIGATREIHRDIFVYRKIVEILHTLGHGLARDWIEPAYHESLQGTIQDNDWKTICAETLSAIERADLVIAEVSDSSSFGVGYQAAMALQKKKPLLILKKINASSGAFISGLSDTLLTRKEYNEEDLESIIKAFIQANSIRTKDLRFNFVIDRQIYNHLNRKAERLGKTKAEIVRDLVLEHMRKNGRGL